MDFLHGQETLSTIDWILRAIIAFFFAGYCKATRATLYISIKTN